MMKKDSTADRPAEQPKSTRSRRGRRLLAAIIIILLLSLIGVSALLVSMVVPSGDEIAGRDEARGLEWVRSIYGWGDTIDTHLYLPRELNLGPDGTIWATDSQYKEVFAFSPEGALLKRLGSTVTDRMVGFGPVAVGPENALYLGEPELDRIRVLSADGEDLGTFPFPDPTDIEYRDGVMVIGSTSGFAFVDPNDGKPIKTVGEHGKEDGQFDTVGGLTIGPDGTVYVVDSYNNELEAYNGDGELLWSVSTGAPSNEIDVTGAGATQASQVETAPAGLQLPGDVCLDGNGRVVVVDPFAFTIAVFDAADGTFIAKYGQDGRKDGLLSYPSSIAYDPARDWFVVADTGNHRIQILRIPDSAPFSVAASVRRSLTGPLRACVAPLVLLLIAIVAFLLRGRGRRKREKLVTAVQVETGTGPGVAGEDTASDGETVTLNDPDGT